MVFRAGWLLVIALMIPACGAHSGGGGVPASGPAGLLLRGGTFPTSIQYLTAAGLTLFFIYEDGIHGTELWKSDGTPQGTMMVKDICPGPVSSRPTNLMALGSVLMFSADDGVHGMELWKSDGTETGTVMVKDINPGSGSGIYYGGSETMAVRGGTLFFAGTDGGEQAGLFF